MVDISQLRMSAEERAEHTDWAARNRNKYPIKDPDIKDFVEGLMQGLGLRIELQAVYDEDNKIVRFPFLDKYWDRPGIIYLTKEEIKAVSVGRMTYRTKIAMKNAYEAGELDKLCDPARNKGVNHLIGWAGV